MIHSLGSKSTINPKDMLLTQANQTDSNRKTYFLYDKICIQNHTLKWRGSLFLTTSTTVVSFSTVAPAVAEGNGIKLSKPFSFLGFDDTLWWRDFVSNCVIAVRVCHVLQPEVAHFGSLYWADAKRNSLRILGTTVTLGHMLNGINCTAMQNKVWELSNIGCILVIYSIFASIGCPIRCIPYGCIQSHWLCGEISSHWFCSNNFPDRNIIHEKSA